jgi:carbonic anhydrase
MVHAEVLTANNNYAESFGEKTNLPLAQGRKFDILGCMDAQHEPAKYAELG